MTATEQAGYRLRLAEGFLREARQDCDMQRWRSCVDNSQLAAENAAKAVLALLGPLGRTHKPDVFLLEALGENRFPENLRTQIEEVAECARLLGPEVHIKSDYGDEQTQQTPWELFDAGPAREALGMAEKAASLAKQVVERGLRR
jgi:HEPN domain-containing protein